MKKVLMHVPTSLCQAFEDHQQPNCGWEEEESVLGVMYIVKGKSLQWYGH